MSPSSTQLLFTHPLLPHPQRPPSLQLPSRHQFKCPRYPSPWPTGQQLATSTRPLRRPRPPTHPTFSTRTCCVGESAKTDPIPSPTSPPTYFATTRQILGLAIPALGALALDPLLSLVDTAFVGRLGVSPIAGVGLATLLLNVSFSLFNFLCISITPIVAKAIYQSPNNPSAASRPISIALCLAALLGTITGTTLFTFARPLAISLSATAEVLPYAVTYLRARAVAIPLALMSFAANGAMRAFRDLKTPFWVAVIANTANISLDMILMFYFQLGVLGAALATSIAQVIGFILMTGHLFAKRRILLKDIKAVICRPPMKEIKPMMSAGVLLAVRTCCILSTVAYATKSAAAMGEISLAAFELCRQLWVFNSTMLDSFATAAQALVASAMASKKIQYARSVAKQAVLLSVIAAICFAVGAVCSGSKLPGIFTVSDEVKQVALNCIRMAAVCAPVNGLVFAMDGVLAACADYRYLAGGIALASCLACVAVTCVGVMNGSVVWLWGSLNVLMAARAVVLVARFVDTRTGPMRIER